MQCVGGVVRNPFFGAFSLSALVAARHSERTGATSAAELLRAVPGGRSESSRGEGNVSITVCGVPLSAGGSRYVQIQEDGLPVLMFGDIAFGTADQFLRAGIDPRTACFITPSLQRDVGLNRDNGGTISSTRDGLRVKSTAVGLEAQLTLGEGWTLDEKFRRSPTWPRSHASATACRSAPTARCTATHSAARHPTRSTKFSKLKPA